MTTTSSTGVDRSYQLRDRFERESGRVFLTGWDALVKLPLLQRARDAAHGLDTAGFVSGYPGSPLGGLDSLLRAERERLAAAGIHFEPGLNEDLAATAVWGTQYVNYGPVSSRYDGVFAMWYGKGPGVERSTDALRSGNYQGVARHGGVLVLAGDDHDARSTITAQQSETLFVHMHMPVLNPADVAELIEYGLVGWALSRYSSSYVGMICLNDTVDAGGTVDLDRLPAGFVLPDADPAPEIGTGAVGVAGAGAIERQIRELRLPAAQAFARANRLDRVIVGGEPGTRGRRIGVIASGKASLDVVDALELLGIPRDRAGALGISVYKVAMPYPLEPVGVAEFAEGLDEVVVVEPKHPLIEDQVARIVRTIPVSRRPRVVGKTDDEGRTVVRSWGALDSVTVAEALHSRLVKVLDPSELRAPARASEPVAVTGAASTAPAGEPANEPALLARAAGYCAGCPHNTSTKVPDGAWAIGGTGCHGMAIRVAAPGRAAYMNTHMGGEGGLWVGIAPFADSKHTFQNLGDGTYSHSGSLAIRAAVAAGVNMTFKILVNGYIAMTGGQAIAGGLTSPMIAAQVLAEGVERVVVVTDDVAAVRKGGTFPAGVEVRDRSELITTQRALSEVEGVTVLIYDQACAAELRRERRRGRAPEPEQRVFIHPTVCEGCGDCNLQSNCISVEPLETELGRKREINQSSCNKDYTCVQGYCPSFLTLRGATPRRVAQQPAASDELAGAFATLPVPTVADASQPYDIVVGGIGGGGVLTIGSLLGMAAHLEGKSATVLNESGLAQKNGAVQSHVRIVADPDAELSARVARQSADLLIGADVVVSASPRLASTLAPQTRAVVNTDVRPTIDFSRDRDLDLDPAPLVDRLRGTLGEHLELVDAHRMATALLGDAIYANLVLLGYAAQRGWLPVSLEALQRAVELNGVAVDDNLKALEWGRLAAHDLESLAPVLTPPTAGVPVALTAMRSTNLDDLVASRRAFLAAYQDEPWAERYERVVREVADAEQRRSPGATGMAFAVAENLFRLMSYKDEYEVARLYADGSWREMLDERFEGDYRVSFNLAPQVMNRRDANGRARKVAIPAKVAMPTFKLLARGKRLRGTRLDVFGRTQHRRRERARIDEYVSLVEELSRSLTSANHDLAVRIASLPESIRGYDTVKDEAAEQADEALTALLREWASANADVA